MNIEEAIVQPNFKSPQQKLAINLIYTHHWLANINEQLFKNKEITSQQFNILRILKGQYPKAAGIKLLRERMLDKMSDVSRLVEKARKKGWLTRIINKKDRRAVDVLITPKGLALLEELKEIDNIFETTLSTL
ncbi:MAG: MarR family transcriptional regulator, partial [Bacteroidia bacterium]|nr:MarR family transcriptional regulator [Bacteroidia bacterium]